MSSTLSGHTHHPRILRDLLLATISILLSSCGITGTRSLASTTASPSSPGLSALKLDTGPKSVHRGRTYADVVLADSPEFFWRLDEAPGAGSASEAVLGSDLGALEGGAQFESFGLQGGSQVAQSSSERTGLNLNGQTGYMTTGAQVRPAESLTLELWFRTSSPQGGVLFSFGNSQLGGSAQVDRVLYLSNDGTLRFSWAGGSSSLASKALYNDGQWHYAAASLSPRGAVLYVDGLPIATSVEPGSPTGFSGYWRLGYDQVQALPGAPSSDFLEGSISNAAVYSGKTLSASQIQAHFLAFQ